MSRWASVTRLLPGLVVLSAGCGLVPPPYQLAEGAPPSRDFHRVVLLPMNFDYSPSPAIAQGAALVGTRIRGHLEARGKEVVQVRMSTTLALWKECIADERSGEIDEDVYERARSELVRRVLASIDADGVVAGAVIVREGRYEGKKLHWDGSSRAVSIDMAKTNMPVLHLNGTDPGTLLRTTVFDRDGNKIFERYVGLEPIRSYRVEWPRLRPVDRSDLFQDAALLEEGVSRSFEPWLSPPANPDE